MKKLGILAILLFAVACGSSSAPAIVAAPTVDITGTYSTTVVTNPDLATWTNCTGDLAIAEGLTVSDTADFSCVTSDPLVITQNGGTWSAGNQFWTCTMGTYVQTGSGRVAGDNVTGIYTSDYSEGFFETDTIGNGFVGTGGSLTLRITRARLSGFVVGACNLSPALEIVLSQTRAAQTHGISLLGSL